MRRDGERYRNFYQRLYRQVMVDFDVSQNAVSNGISKAIAYAFDNAPPELLEEYFGNSISRQRGIATGKQFLYTLARRLRHDDEGC